MNPLGSALATAAFIALAGLGLACLASDRLFRTATGFVELGSVGSPGHSGARSVSADTAGRFLEERNTLEIELDRDMSAGEMLARYRIGFQHVRDQMEEQLGVPELPDGHPLPKGTRFRIQLTPRDTTLP